MQTTVSQLLSGLWHLQVLCLFLLFEDFVFFKYFKYVKSTFLNTFYFEVSMMQKQLIPAGR